MAKEDKSTSKAPENPNPTPDAAKAALKLDDDPSDIRHARYLRDEEPHEDGGKFDVVYDADARKPYRATSSHRFWEGSKEEFFRDFEYI